MLLHELIFENIAQFSEAPAIVDGEKKIRYGDILEQSEKIAHFLTQVLEVKRGDRVALLTRKNWKSIISILGILRAGAAFVPVNINLPPRTLQFILQDCGIKTIFTDENSEKLSDFQDSPCPLINVVSLTDHDLSKKHGTRWNIFFYDRIIQAEQGNGIPLATTISKDLAYIIYTSGSTGIPKGVMISHAAIEFVVKYRRDFLAFSDHTKLISVSPLYFDIILNEIFCTLSRGGELHLVDDTYRLVTEKSSRFLHHFLGIIAAEKITHFFCVPALLNLISSNLGVLAEYDLGSLESITFGAGSCSVKTIQRLADSLPNVKFVHGYGLTETAVTACSYRIRDPYAAPFESFPIGDPIPDTEFFVMDEKDRCISEGNVGELAIRGPHLMNGYWNNERETQRVLRNNPLHPERNENIFFSGDLVRVETDGSLIFVGRKDDQIKSAGYRIELGEIEMRINNYAGIRESAVIAVPDPFLQHKIKCFLVLAGGYALDDVVRYCRDNLTSYTVPHMWAVLDMLPKNHNGKIDKKALKALETDAR